MATTTTRRILQTLTLAALPLLATAATAAPLTEQLHPVLDGAWRSDANRARDSYRHPAQTLEFFGLRSDATVIEITPGAGWYAEILAPLLKERGHYVAAIVDPAKAPADRRAYQQGHRDRLTAKFQADAERYGAARIVAFDPQAPQLGEPASADFVLTFRNVHNWVKAGTAQPYFNAFFDVLKPGGVLGVVDHRARPGSAPETDSGYVPVDEVIQLATQAGFKLDASSEINANPKDTKDHPKGVWTLPPSLALGAQERDRYLAIGESDRFTLRFVKPQ